MADVIVNIRINAIDQASAVLRQIGQTAQTAMRQAGQQASQMAQSMAKSGGDEFSRIMQGMQQSLNSMAQTAGPASVAVGKAVEDVGKKVEDTGKKASEAKPKMYNLEQAFRHPIRTLLDLSGNLRTTNQSLVTLVATCSLAVSAVAAVAAGFAALVIAGGALAIKLGRELISAIQSVIKGFVDLANAAAPLESLRYTFANFAEGANMMAEGWSGTADSLIRDMRRATYGAISTTDMLKSANLAFMFMGEQVASELPRLLAIAQHAAVATGQDMEFMFSSLVRGIGRLSSRWLDNLGIIVRAEDEYDRYAKKIGKLAENLTQAEQVQAMMEGALREGEAMMIRVGDVSGLLSVRVGALQASFQDLHDNILSLLAPLFSVIIGWANGILSQALPLIQQFASGFMDALAQLPPASQMAMAGMSDAIVSGSEEAMAYAADDMGRAAADWAVNAATWGANVGAQFAIGILNGFTAMIVGVMNAISSMLASWFAPGSPPKVVPEIDRWGAKTIGEWVKGMVGAANKLDLGSLTDALQKQLEGGVKQQLFDWGVSAIEAWAKGLSIIDLEFLIKNVEKQLDRAKKSVDALTDKMSQQRRELFKMQVLNKDPTAIRNKMREVQSTESLLKGAESEVDMLEERRDALKEQLELFRLLLRAIKDMQDTAGGGAAAGGIGGAGGGIEIPEPALKMPTGAALDLEGRLGGIQDTLAGIFEPFGAVVDAFNEDVGKIQDAWNNLVRAFEESTLLETITTVINNFEQSWGTFTENIQRNWDTLKKNWNDSIAELFGGPVDLGPLIAGIIDAYVDFALGVINGIVKGLAGGDFATGFFEGFLEQFAGKEVNIDEQVAIWFGNIAKTIDEKLQEAKTAVATWVADIIVSLAQWGGNIYEKAVETWENIKSTITTTIDEILASMGLNGEEMRLRWAKIGEDIVLIIETLKTDIETIWAIIVAIIYLKIREIYTDVQLIITALQIWWATTWNNIKAKIEEIWNAIIEAITPIVQEVYTIVTGKIQEIMDWIKNQWDTFVTIGGMIIEGLKSGVLAKAGELINAATGAVEDAIQAAKNALGIQSPSKVFAEIGTNMVRGLMTGMDFAPAISKMHSDLGRMSRGGFGLGTNGMIAGGAIGTGNVYVDGPLLQVDSLVVPNQRVGRQFAKDLSEEVGNMISARRVGA